MSYFETKTLELGADLFIESNNLYEYADKVRVRAARNAPELAGNEDPEMRKKKTWKDQKKLLRQYEEACDDDGFVQITLRRSANKPYGRVFPKGGRGFCMMKRRTRHAIMGARYVDFDLGNCHVAIYHDTLSRNCPDDDLSALKHIIDKREELNAQYGKDKAFWPALLYGLKTDVPRDPFFHQQLLPAISRGLDRIKKDNLELYKAVCDSKEDGKNPDGAFLSAYLSEIETRIISDIIQHLFISTEVLQYGDKKPVCAYEYDGFKLLAEAVERYGGVAILLEDLNKYIVDKWGFTNVKLVNKPMESALDLSDYLEQAEEELEMEAEKQKKKRKRGGDDDEFQAAKIEFEERHFKVMDPIQFGRIKPDDSVRLLSEYELVQIYRNHRLPGFIKRWLDTPDIRTYETIDFFPPPLTCPSDTFNAYRGLKVEQTYDARRAAYEGLSEEEKAATAVRFQLVMTHIFNQSGCDDSVYEYQLSWISFLIQRPGEKPMTALVILSDQGTGKGLLWTFIGKTILGDSLFYYDPKADNLLGKFALATKNRVLVVSDESNGKDNKEFFDTMKARITETTQVIEQKGKDKIVTNDCSSWVLLSNKSFVVDIEPSDRRYCVFRASDNRANDSTYFTPLLQAMKDPFVAMLFYEFCKIRDISDFDPRIRPVTEAYYQAKSQSRPIVSKFIHDYLERHNFLVKEKVTNSLGQEVEEYTRRDLVYANEFFESFQYYLTDIGGDKSKWRRDRFGTAVMAEIGKMEPCEVDGKRSMKQVMKTKRNDRRCYILDTKHIMEKFAKQGYVEKEDAEEDVTHCTLPVYRDPMLDPDEDQRRW